MDKVLSPDAACPREQNGAAAHGSEQVLKLKSMTHSWLFQRTSVHSERRSAQHLFNNQVGFLLALVVCRQPQMAQ